MAEEGLALVHSIIPRTLPIPVALGCFRAKIRSVWAANQGLGQEWPPPLGKKRQEKGEGYEGNPAARKLTLPGTFSKCEWPQPLG